MPGRGPAPKPPDQRARRNKPAELRVIHAEPCAQPKLPSGFQWPAQTRAWWRMWAASPLAEEFTSTDWSELLDTALIHAELWRGNVRCAAELRQRVSNFGATPLDRARLKITFAAAEDAVEKRGSRQSSKARFAGVKLVG